MSNIGTASPGVAIAAALTALLIACGNPKPPERAPKDEHSQSASAVVHKSPASPQPTLRHDVVPQPPSTEVPKGEIRRCRLEVDGHVHVNGKCEVYPMGDGGYTLNTWTSGKPKNSHFAVVAILNDQTAEASWNADPDDSKAMDRLGVVTQHEGCWTNDRAKICAY